MTTTWTDFLTTQGAHLADGRVAHFGDATAERTLPDTAPRLADLSHWGLIAFSGEEAQTFLHGQITNDLRPLTPQAAVLAGYCSPKGRLMADFFVMKRGDELLLMLPDNLRDYLQKRLSMFILRARVKARDAGGEWIRLGLMGPGAAERVAEILGQPAPAADRAVAQGENAFALRLGPDWFVLFIAPDQARAAWNGLAAWARPVGEPVWRHRVILAGLPLIQPATQDQFVPQMANLERLGGVSFQKGCYPGQEIVARTQYLGKLKRRAYLAHVDADAQAGGELFSADLPGQSCGMVVDAAPAPGGGNDLLAVMLETSREAGDVRLGSPDGPRLDFRALPYEG